MKYFKYWLISAGVLFGLSLAFKWSHLIPAIYILVGGLFFLGLMLFNKK